MNARDEALDRDLSARARLANDPIYQIKQRRGRNEWQRPGSGIKASLDADILSPRETEVLRYMSHGLTRQMTADAIGISVETVMTYLKRAREALGAKNTIEACCEAVRRGLIL